MRTRRLGTVAGFLLLTLSAAAWAGDRTVKLWVDGIGCPLCIPAAQKALRGVEGVKSAEVKGDKATVIIGAEATDAELLEALREAGFPARVAD